MLHELVHELKLLIRGINRCSNYLWGPRDATETPRCVLTWKRSITKIFYKLFWTLIGPRHMAPHRLPTAYFESRATDGVVDHLGLFVYRTAYDLASRSCNKKTARGSAIEPNLPC